MEGEAKVVEATAGGGVALGGAGRGVGFGGVSGAGEGGGSL